MVAPTVAGVYGSPAPTGAFSSTANSASPATCSVTVAAGDVLLVVGTVGSGGQAFSTPTGGSLTYTLLATMNTNTSASVVGMWSATAPGAQTFTLSLACTGATTAQEFGMTAFQLSNAASVGTPAIVTSTGTAAGTVGITTTSANSAIVATVNDWNAIAPGTTPTYSTATAGAYTTERVVNPAGTATTNGTQYVSYVGYYADAGAAGAKTVGVTSNPTTMRPTIWAVEVVGAAGGGSTPKPERVPPNPARYRSSNW